MPVIAAPKYFSATKSILEKNVPFHTLVPTYNNLQVVREHLLGYQRSSIKSLFLKILFICHYSQSIFICMFKFLFLFKLLFDFIVNFVSLFS